MFSYHGNCPNLCHQSQHNRLRIHSLSRLAGYAADADVVVGDAAAVDHHKTF